MPVALTVIGVSLYSQKLGFVSLKLSPPWTYAGRGKYAGKKFFLSGGATHVGLFHTPWGAVGVLLSAIIFLSSSRRLSSPVDSPYADVGTLYAADQLYLMSAPKAFWQPRSLARTTFVRARDRVHLHTKANSLLARDIISIAPLLSLQPLLSKDIAENDSASYYITYIRVL